MTRWKKPGLAMAIAIASIAAACGTDSPNAPTVTTAGGSGTPPQLTAPAADSPANEEQLSTLRPTLTVKNGTSSQPSGTRTYEFQISDSSTFTATTSMTFAGFAVTVSKTGVAEDPSGKTSFQPDQDLQPTTLYYWRARVAQGTVQSDWSAVSQFKTKLVGYSKAGELYDPLIFGETVGTIVGSTTFIPGKGIQINNGTSFVKYLVPQTITSGEFSMDVEGLRGNAPGDKAKVFGMSEGDCTNASANDFITNRYRVDIQYRGTTGVPPNAITFRALYGSADDLDVRYEPPTATRYASVFNLNPATTYHWKATWGREFRVVVLEGGRNGTILYNVGMASLKGTYAPNPHYAYLGAPVGRSGTESASVANAIYRNVWLADHPRPASLGSALRPR